MKEKPILFSGEMVKAILDGTKTQTRRVVKGKFIPGPYDVVQLVGDEEVGLWAPRSKSGKMFIDHTWRPFRCPYGVPGDRLWVRERWWTKYEPNQNRSWAGVGEYCKDTCVNIHGKIKDRDGYHPSIHMFRWLSRITLEITDIRVERVQDITEEDARAEGITDGGCLICGEHEPCGCSNPQPDARDAFAWLWDSINKKRGYGWSTNPWVWVVEFRRVES